MRYQIVNISESAHYCFEATVVDTKKPQNYHKPIGPSNYYWVCECFLEEDAIKIAKALNDAEIASNRAGSFDPT